MIAYIELVLSSSMARTSSVKGKGKLSNSYNAKKMKPRYNKLVFLSLWYFLTIRPALNFPLEGVVLDLAGLGLVMTLSIK